MRFFPFHHLPSSNINLLSPPSTHSHTLSSFPLDSRTDPNCITPFGSLFRPCTTICLTTHWLRALSQSFSGSLIVSPSLPSRLGFRRDSVSRQGPPKFLNICIKSPFTLYLSREHEPSAPQPPLSSDVPKMPTTVLTTVDLFQKFHICYQIRSSCLYTVFQVLSDKCIEQWQKYGRHPRS